MKRIIAICLIALLSFCFTQTVYAGNAYHNQFTAFEYEDRPSLKIENSFLEYPKTFDLIKTHYEELTQRIPADISMKLKETELTVHYVNDCMDYWPTRKVVIEAAGFFGGDYIYISVSFDPDEAIINMDYATFHELGHAAAAAFGRLDQADELERCFKEDIKKNPIGAPDSKMEMFAEIFDMLMRSLGEGDSPISRVDAFRKYPLSAEYVTKTLDLPRYYDEFYYWNIRSSIYAILKEYRNAQNMFG